MREAVEYRDAPASENLPNADVDIVVEQGFDHLDFAAERGLVQGAAAPGSHVDVDANLKKILWIISKPLFFSMIDNVISEIYILDVHNVIFNF